MNTSSKEPMVTRAGARTASAEQRLQELGIKLPAPPAPFGTYVEAVQRGNLLFLSGMLLGTPVELEVIFEVAG